MIDSCHDFLQFVDLKLIGDKIKNLFFMNIYYRPFFPIEKYRGGEKDGEI